MMNLEMNLFMGFYIGSNLKSEVRVKLMLAVIRAGFEHLMRSELIIQR